MPDIALEIIRAFFMGIIFAYLWLASSKENLRHEKGWSYIIAGFGLIFFAGLIDITDNFPRLNKFIIIGDTIYEAFLEKVVGYLFGFFLLAMGFCKWLPNILARRKVESELRRAHDELEMRVAERTADLNAANEQLQREVAERKVMEQELVRAEKLASLGVLSGGAAHEICNPLNIISMRLHLFLQDANLDTSLYNAYRQMLDQVERIREIVNGLEIFAQQMQVERHSVAIQEELARALQHLGGKVREAGIEVVEDFLLASPVVVGNSVLLHRAFEKIVDNAVEAMTKGGRLVLQVRENASNGEAWGTIRITDTGVGISQQDLSKVFDPFFTTREVNKGKGLGLSIALGIVEDHGGTISVESIVGLGTTFIIQLPLEHKEKITT
jgi:C4-dicarboxylate-specific signal transduction histidine kinase